MSDKEARLFEVQHRSAPPYRYRRWTGPAAAAREWGRPVDGDRQRL